MEKDIGGYSFASNPESTGLIALSSEVLKSMLVGHFIEAILQLVYEVLQ